MTFTHDDIQQRLIEFLYDELDVAARAAFQAHTATCERCRADVAALVETRAMARAVVRAPLDHAAPSPVHDRIMQIATGATSDRAAVAAKARALSPAAPSATPPTRAAGDSSPPRWWAWLRGRWTLPMFAAVAAMATLILGRETIFREALRPVGETPLAELAPSPVSPLPAPAKPSFDRETDDEASARDTKRVAPPATAPVPAAPPSSARGKAKAERESADPTGSALAKSAADCFRAGRWHGSGVHVRGRNGSRDPTIRACRQADGRTTLVRRRDRLSRSAETLSRAPSGRHLAPQTCGRAVRA